jgi:hypothetical protein
MFFKHIEKYINKFDKNIYLKIPTGIDIYSFNKDFKKRVIYKLSKYEHYILIEPKFIINKPMKNKRKPFY